MKQAGEFVASVLTTGLILAVFFLLGWMACGCRGPTTHIVPVLQPSQPACIVVLGPPPAPPISFSEMTYRCRTPEGRRLASDEMCLSTAEADDLQRFAAQASLYAITAYRACSYAEPGASEGVRVLP